MRGLAFTLSGKTAMFKKPDVNSSVYLTFNHIHKVALLGLLGAILGLEGVAQQYNYNMSHDDRMPYPEYYQQLQELRVAIVPLSEKGYFSKKLQVFNNSVGYASKEEGGNLVVKEYWLENPCWDIYLYTPNQKLITQLENYILGHKNVYTPYLGKNDHLADISNRRIVAMEHPEQVKKVNSLVAKEAVTYGRERKRKVTVPMYMLQESLPIELVPYHNIYTYEMFHYTNQPIASYNQEEHFFSCEEKTLYMF